MDEYYELRWFVCKDIYIHESIDREFIESEKVYKEIEFEGIINTKYEDVEPCEGLESIGILKNMNLGLALKQAYNLAEGIVYPDEEEPVEIFVKKIIVK